MTLRPTHEIHTRRFGRNLGLGLTLGAFVLLVFALSVVKITRGDTLLSYEHARPAAAEGTP